MVTGTTSWAEQWASGDGWLVDLVLPRTDGGVAAQVMVVTCVAVLVLWRVRDRPEARFFVLSATFMVMALFAIRAIH